MVSPDSAEPSRFFARFVAFLAISVGGLVSAGWLLGLDQLTNFLPSWSRMAALTGLCFV